MPRKTPLDAVVHGRFEREGFTVDKVYLESYPGHFVTGLLFRPKGKAGRLPAVLCPHGHGGRLQDYGEKQIRQLIVKGAERFEGSGRYPKLARCAQLARMGCVVFIYDMLGYADSVQISRAVAHGFSKQRPEMDSKESWGLFSTQAELRLQSVMGVQTYNSLRALDFLCQLEDVDPSRLGVTGGSGGGTQTILLCAFDPRPVVAFPQGMVSTAMQGGCTCENCCLLRIGTGNVELAALFAPKPQGMTAANDWTKEMMTKGYPELQQLYGLLGAKGNVICEPQLHFPHNYNYVTRAMMYHWFNRHLKLGLEEPIVEEDFPPLAGDELTVWDQDHPRPEGGPDYERSLTKWMDDDSNRQIDALTPTDASSLDKYRQTVGGAFDIIIGRKLPAAHAIEREERNEIDRGNYVEFTYLVRNTQHGEELPVVSLFPKRDAWNKQVVIWVDGTGKAALFEPDGGPRPAIRQLLEAGTAVLGADLLYHGEFLSDGQPPAEARVVKNPREFAGYTFCYNDTLFAQRVHDILTLISFVKNSPYQPEEIGLVGTGGAGPWVAAARAQARDDVNQAAIDTQGFRFVHLSSYRDLNFLPGAVKYGDMPGLLALSAPGKLWLAGEGGKLPKVVSAAYEAAGAEDRVYSDADPADPAAAAVQWLLGQ
jgi:dienelactone hydrolase